MPYIASAQLVCGPLTIGRATDIAVTAKPSKTPRIPRVSTIFQNIDSSPANKVGTKPNFRRLPQVRPITLLVKLTRQDLNLT